MLFATVPAAALRDAAAWVVRLTGGRQHDPVLQGIFIESQGDTLCLSAWDYDNGGTAGLSAIIRDPGRALVSGKLLAAIAKTVDPARDISLIVDDRELRMTSGRNVWTLPMLAVEDYPRLPTTGDMIAKLDAATLRRAVHRILPAADRSRVAPLNGMVNFFSAGQRLGIVATDRWRFALAEIDWHPVDADEEIDILVPTTFLDATFAALGPSSDAAEFGATSGLIHLATPSRRLVGRLGAERWPTWRDRLPSPDAPVSAIFVVSEVVTALARVMAVVEDDEKPVRFTMSDDGIEIETIGSIGTASADATVGEYRGSEKMAGVKPRFLKAALDAMESDLAVLRTSPPGGAPLDFVPLNDDGEPETDYRHIVMPIDPRRLGKRA